MSEALAYVGRRPESVAPIPHIVDRTTYVPAGRITIGVEYRLVNDDVIKAEVAAGRRKTAHAIDEVVGPSIHVFDSNTLTEYLRFDAFNKRPHYHYITPGSHHIVVSYDAAANGDCIEWVLRTLSTQLVAMLEEAGARELALSIDMNAVIGAIEQVRKALEPLFVQ